MSGKEDPKFQAGGVRRRLLGAAFRGIGLVYCPVRLNVENAENQIIKIEEN
jgi:hypothetical protein